MREGGSKGLLLLVGLPVAVAIELSMSSSIRGGGSLRGWRVRVFLLARGLLVYAAFKVFPLPMDYGFLKLE